MKKFDTLNFSLIVLLLLNNCQSGVQDDEFKLLFPVKIDMEEIVNQPITNINLSMVADSLEYIQLETCSEALIARIFQVALTKDFVFVRTNRNILKFSRSGKYLSQISSQGRGPGDSIN